MRATSIAVALIGLITLVGCAGTTYYQVKDPGTGKTYYTTKYDKEKSGAVSLKDDKTKSEVTVQNSEIMEITKDQYQAGLHGSNGTPADK
jgi:hypothetical protein